jgi:hypothetical protein
VPKDKTYILIKSHLSYFIPGLANSLCACSNRQWHKISKPQLVPVGKSGLKMQSDLAVYSPLPLPYTAQQRVDFNFSKVESFGKVGDLK